nr:unnamed protein product [Spirometra erinaceieuropaei]
MLAVDRKCKTRDRIKKQQPLSPTAPPPSVPSHIQLDNPGNNQQERRTAIVTGELTRYKVDATAPRVTLFSEQD